MITLLVTYMHMEAPPIGAPPASPLPGAAVVREYLKASDYLDLYRRVGAAVQWDSRLRMTLEAVDAWLANDANHVHVLRLDGIAAGLCEFEAVGSAEIELMHFGIVPAVQGKGLGSFLLDHALRDCWRSGPRRIWLHTDTNDHPRAVATYAKAGFVPYLQRMENFED